MATTWELNYLKTMATGGGVLPPGEERDRPTSDQVEQSKDKEKQEKKGSKSKGGSSSDSSEDERDKRKGRSRPRRRRSRRRREVKVRGEVLPIAARTKGTNERGEARKREGMIGDKRKGKQVVPALAPAVTAPVTPAASPALTPVEAETGMTRREIKESPKESPRESLARGSLTQTETQDPLPRLNVLLSLPMVVMV